MKFYNRCYINVRNVHGEKTDFQCITCGKFYESEKALKIHENAYHSISVKCDICDKIFGSYTRLKSHKISHRNKDIKCPQCDFYTATKG